MTDIPTDAPAAFLYLSFLLTILLVVVIVIAVYTTTVIA